MCDLTRRRVQHEIVAQHSDCCEESLILQVPEGEEGGGGESARGSQDKHSVTPTWPPPPFHLPVPYVDDEGFFF